MDARDLKGVRRAVIKIGSSVLADPDGGLRPKVAAQLARACHQLMTRHRLQIVLVSSGAIACGMQKLGYQRRPKSTGVLQACAATGQPDLMQAYERAFARYKRHTAQILLTHDGLSDRTRFIHAKHTLHALLKHHVVPIVNENDTVAVEEIRVGDNDTLAAFTGSLIDADLVILLTDCDGLYDRDPRLHQDAVRVPLVHNIDQKTVAMATGALSPTRVGGMSTKISAAAMAASFGMRTIIADGNDPQVLTKIFAGKDCGTLFLPSAKALRSRKHWLAHAVKPRGRLILDAGACRALRRDHKSLLAAGVTKVRGRFQIGDPVDLESPTGEVFARGLVNYSADELQKIRGEQSKTIVQILGYRYADEVISREEMVMLGDNDGHTTDD